MVSGSDVDHVEAMVAAQRGWALRNDFTLNSGATGLVDPADALFRGMLSEGTFRDDGLGAELVPGWVG